MAGPAPLPFEKEICEMEELLAKMESSQNGQASDEIRRMRRELTNLIRKVYSNLSAWDTVRVSRHNDRPQTLDYIKLIFEEFVELHGDRALGDDRAIRTGFARLGDFRVMLIGHQKGHTLKERNDCLYGCAHPEGYRKALSKMRLAAKFHLPIICLIDTPGAYPGIGAEERGQAQLIANSILEMARLATPIICVVIGEGGSGGALGIGIGDRVSMLEHAYYSVISPEGCAGILWKVATEETKPLAAEALYGSDGIGHGSVTQDGTLNFIDLGAGFDTLNIDGDYSQTSNAITSMNIGAAGGGNDDLTVGTHDVAVGGTLNVSGSPAGRGIWTLFVGATVSGGFATINLPAAPAGLQWSYGINAPGTGFYIQLS